MTSDRGEHDDVTGVLTTQNWERGFDKVDLGEEDVFELVANEILGDWRGREFLDVAYYG